MKSVNYWQQFLDTGRVEDYLCYVRQQGQASGADRREAFAGAECPEGAFAEEASAGTERPERVFAEEASAGTERPEGVFAGTARPEELPGGRSPEICRNSCG